MIKNLLKKTWIPIILIGTFCTAIAIILRNEPEYTIINTAYMRIGYYDWHYYTFDVQSYLKNIEGSLRFNYISNVQSTIPNTPIWPTFSSDVVNNILSVLKFIANGLFFIVNCLIYFINWGLMAPIKLLLYPINVICSLLAINTSSSTWNQTLIGLINLEIPYIPFLT